MKTIGIVYTWLPLQCVFLSSKQLWTCYSALILKHRKNFMNRQLSRRVCAKPIRQKRGLLPVSYARPCQGISNAPIKSKRFIRWFRTDCSQLEGPKSHSMRKWTCFTRIRIPFLTQKIILILENVHILSAEIIVLILPEEQQNLPNEILNICKKHLFKKLFYKL